MMQDPTEYPRIDHTTPAYPHSNLYERTTPYNLSDIPIPPPPPKPRRNWLKGIAIIGVVLIVLVGIGAFGLVAYYAGKVSNSVTPTQVVTPTHAVPTIVETIRPVPTSTLAPTPTLIPTIGHTPTSLEAAPYPAIAIVSDFQKAGIIIRSATYDAKWSCCTYFPEGGAYYWNDPVASLNVDIATFATPQEVLVDAQQLNQQGYDASYLNNCLLSYESGFPRDELTRYQRVMQSACD